MNMSIINLFVFCLTLFLILFVFNVAKLATEKVDLQNTVDEAAVSAAVVRARGMNSVTAINHLIGELMALVILHESIGGERTHVENGKYPEAPRLTKNLNWWLTFFKSRTKSARDRIFKTVRQAKGFQADRAVLRSKRDAKRALMRVYFLMAIVEKTPIPKAREIAIAALQLWEEKIGIEYKILDGLEKFAARTYPARKYIEKKVVPHLRRLQDSIIESTPRLAMLSAKKLGKLNSAEIWIDTADLTLPLRLDPNASRFVPIKIPAIKPVRSRPKYGSIKVKRGDRQALRNQIVKTTQLARASYPWVLYHRRSLLSYAWILRNSKFKENYELASYRVTVELLDKLQRPARSPYVLYVLADYPTPNKGYALWNENGGDHLFTLTCIGSRKGPTQLGSAVFGKRPKRAVVIAQAMTYNANRQRRMDAMISPYRRPVRFRLQAPIGWDTLNFRRRMSEVVTDPKHEGFPSVKLNWQCKLLPIASHLVRNKLKVSNNLQPKIKKHLQAHSLESEQLPVR